MIKQILASLKKNKLYTIPIDVVAFAKAEGFNVSFDDANERLQNYIIEEELKNE